PQHVGSRELERFGGLLLEIPAPPEDRGATLRRDYAIPCILEHEYAVSKPNTQGATRCPLANNDNNDRDFQSSHLEKIACNRFGLSALFGLDAGKRAGGVQ